MKTLGYLFTQGPHSTSSGREGIDALLAASAYSESIKVMFIGDGVLQLLAGQSTESILSKDYAPMMKLFDLYDIEQVYVCKDSLAERGCSHADLIIDVEHLSADEIRQQITQCHSVLTF
ncbi:sulfurtransferase complex subunit TusC [Vibrio agarivorans]|uniref:sulfurtransferase complex subunit TusC n=1 Tax=Vibrio agarivorans TaxID=153622 RepID=UPI00222E8618|nr:sulfurtransferase complex subunit TusC [Vibrio agarivorans]MDN3662310.1 sulfurtransferase complex subunit TusC [Vibrio agarivorans]